MEKRDSKKNLRNFILFIVLILITLGILFKDQSIAEILDIIRNVDIKYILIAILCMIIYIVLEAVNFGRTLKVFGEKSSLLKNIKYALIGFFFSSITPAASGGQPMQIYYMHKENITVANATLSLLINLTCMQITTIVFGLISAIVNYKYLTTPLIIFFIIGISLNMSALALLLISIFSKRLLNGLINLFIKLLKLLRIKNIEQKRERIEKELSKYEESAIFLKQNKKLMLITLLTSIMQFFIYYSISYFTYRALGFNEKNIFQVVSMQALVYATVSGIPSPGAVGVSEGAYIELFRNIYPENLIKSATLVNRGINFYLFVIIAEAVVIINDIVINKKTTPIEINSENRE